MKEIRLLQILIQSKREKLRFMRSYKLNIEMQRQADCLEIEILALEKIRESLKK